MTGRVKNLPRIQRSNQYNSIIRSVDMGDGGEVNLVCMCVCVCVVGKGGAGGYYLLGFSSSGIGMPY